MPLHLPAKREPAGPVEKIEVFSIDDKQYFMPKEVDASIGAQYLLDVAELGTEQASAKLFIGVMGKPALKALAGYKGLTPDEFAGVMDEVRTYVMGQLESPGN